ncbi:MAG: hypothetical protein KA368_16990 [Acidobacteria bacterium]|nr:hypothetical protein [Acidobacteriota bacterium]
MKKADAERLFVFGLHSCMCKPPTEKLTIPKKTWKEKKFDEPIAEAFAHERLQPPFSGKSFT